MRMAWISGTEPARFFAVWAGLCSRAITEQSAAAKMSAGSSYLENLPKDSPAAQFLKHRSVPSLGMHE